MKTFTLEDFEPRLPSGVELEREDDHHNAVETSHQELCDAARVLDHHNRAVDDAVDHMTAMTELSASLAGSQALSQPVMEALELTVRHFVASLGGDKLSVSMEGHTREARLHVALETIGDTMRRVWERLLAAFRAAWDWFKNFVKALFDTSRHLQKRCKKLETLLVSRSDTQSSDTMAHNNRFLNFVGGVNNGGAVTGQEVVNAYHKQSQLMTSVQRVTGDFMANAGTGLKELLTEYNRLADDAPDLQAQKFQEFVQRKVTPLFYSSSLWKKAGASKINDAKAVEAKADTDLYVKEFALGGGRFYGRIISPGVPADKAASAMRHTGFGVSRGAHVTQAHAIKPWNRAECLAAIKLVNERMEEVRAMQAQVKTLNTTLNDLSQAGNFKIVAGHEPLRAKMMEMVAAAAATMMAMTTHSTKSIVHYDIDCAKHMLDLVAANIKTMPPMTP